MIPGRANPPTTLGRRALLGLGLSAGLVAATGCGRSQSTGGGTGTGKLRATWWGNETRQANTLKIIEAFKAVKPDVTISPEFTDWAAYWDKLATQVAGNGAPDIIQMDEKYVREYGGRGALLDLNGKVDVSKFAPGTVEPGQTDTGLMAINAGVNAPVAMVHPKVFAAAGVEPPDDTSWTWDELIKVAAAVTKGSPAGTFGMGSLISNDAAFSAFLRQRGKALFTPTGLAFDVADATDWYTYNLEVMNAKAGQPASVVAEEDGQSLDQGAFATGRLGFGFAWSNQVSAYDNASGEDIALRRYPSEAGRAAETKLWYKASQFWSISSKTGDPDAAVAFVNFLVNSTESGKIGLTERGVPPNTEVRAAIESELNASDKKVIAFLDAIKPELGDTPLAPPIGAGNLPDVVKRYGQEVLFGQTKPADAAAKMIDEINANIQK
ncbi:ABC transporter substrate-binding protein [Microlunatus parietis]|uniref:Multiple sugar transport system substrate-binding protein n=1 Tax=Microlunatus parietis TaxID=682979 RepID=A0A7Y9LEI0_9ACTN|nr:extracellular solute-binding protein [Microlunatus parietis]NYE73066.1 multiple sugar transport system substrate-binding protein [Microlunatus parietis]